MVIKKIIITDYSNYCPHDRADGGRYLFEEEYTFEYGCGWKVEYWTSAIGFDFCARCGNFHSAPECHTKILNDEKILEILNSAIQSNTCEVIILTDMGEIVIPASLHHFQGYCAKCNDEYF